tara:strand:+ start:3111 stop:4076 length:966 start_codon:yes stop_codon:yes gene_type:complete
MGKRMFDLFRTGTRFLLGANKLSVLIYHQTLPHYDPMRPDEITAEQFEQHLRWIKSSFNVLTLDEATSALKLRRLPPRSLVITFDDGYENNCSVALPLLEKYGLVATFFIATDFVDGGLMWNDRIIETLRIHPSAEIDLNWLTMGVRTIHTESERQHLAYDLLYKIKHLPPATRQQAVDRICEGIALPVNLMLSSLQIQKMDRAGMEIGGHSCSHPILKNLETAALMREVCDNKSFLENLLGHPVRSFAYPNGVPEKDYDRRCIDTIKRAGYEQAVTTAWGINRSSDNFFQMRRFTPWQKNRIGFLLQMVRNQLNDTPCIE